MLVQVKKGIDKSIDKRAAETIGNTIDDQVIDDTLGEITSPFANLKIPKDKNFVRIRQGFKTLSDGFQEIPNKLRLATFRDKTGELLPAEKVLTNIESPQFPREFATRTREVISKVNPDAKQALIPALRQRKIIKSGARAT